MMPGITITNGMISLRPAAKTMPFCPSASDFAPRVRWVMYWLRPQ